MRVAGRPADSSSCGYALHRNTAQLYAYADGYQACGGVHFPDVVEKRAAIEGVEVGRVRDESARLEVVKDMGGHVMSPLSVIAARKGPISLQVCRTVHAAGRDGAWVGARSPPTRCRDDP